MTRWSAASVLRLDEDDPVDRPAGREAELVALAPGRTPGGPGSRRTRRCASDDDGERRAGPGSRRPASSQAIEQDGEQLGDQVAAGQQRP